MPDQQLDVPDVDFFMPVCRRELQPDAVTIETLFKDASSIVAMLLVKGKMRELHRVHHLD